MHKEVDIQVNDYIEIFIGRKRESAYEFVHVIGLNKKVIQIKENLDDIGSRNLKRPVELRYNSSEIIRAIEKV